jgi:hypothetical protein
MLVITGYTTRAWFGKLELFHPDFGRGRNAEEQAPLRWHTNLPPRACCNAALGWRYRTRDLCLKAEVWTEVWWTEDVGSIRVQ